MGFTGDYKNTLEQGLGFRVQPGLILPQKKTQLQHRDCASAVPGKRILSRAFMNSSNKPKHQVREQFQETIGHFLRLAWLLCLDNQ